MKLLDRPCYFDVIVSDFGRESAIEFVRSSYLLEKQIIHSELRESNATFFDEYRRLMFVLVGDIAYFKENLIERYSPSEFLDSRILLGIGELRIPLDVSTRLSRAVLEQIVIGIAHGHRKIRVVIPCNTLAPFGDNFSHLVATPRTFLESVASQLGAEALTEQLTGQADATSIRVYTVPQVVLEFLQFQHGPKATLLVLGTSSTRDIYLDAISKAGLDYDVLEPTYAEQALLNETVVASIDGDTDRSTKLSQELLSEVISPRRAEIPQLVVVEACTDFELSLGISSRECFVQRLVREAYGREDGGLWQSGQSIAEVRSQRDFTKLL